jgi:hypothetical protein
VKKLLLIGAPIAAVLIAGVVAYGFLFDRESEAATWIVSTQTGTVEVSLGGGPWVAAEMRQPLTDGDRIRTGDASEVTVLHSESHVTIREQTQLAVAQLNAQHSRFELAEGQVFVEARGNRVAMRSQAGATMQAEDAGVGMTVRRDGWTQVQVKRGEVDFTANDRTERVKEGEESHASVGGPPSKPVRIPETLLLNVQFPDADTFTSRVARIEGKADPGSRVKVGGRTVEVDGTGSFTADVELEEGINQIEVAATDSVGNSRSEVSQPIRVDTLAPGLEGAMIGRKAVAAPDGAGS